MNNKTQPERFALYKEHPKTCAPDDFWGQVKRTVNGKPVSEDQIQMILDAVTAGLGLTSEDFILDLCCGNGALSTRLFTQCLGGLGVDFSEALIKVAKANFEQLPDHRFIMDDVVDHVGAEPEPEKFTKILCYGSFAYLEAHRAEEMLSICHERFTNAATLYIGNLPDKDQMNAFFTERAYEEGIEDEPDSAIGIWRTQEEFRALAARTGWNIAFSTMPSHFYASRYRYDVKLSRA